MGGWAHLAGVLLLVGGAAPAEPGLRTEPAYDALTPYLGLSPTLEDRLLYYQSFDGPELNRDAAEQVGQVAIGGPGVLGGGMPAASGQVLQLRSPACSPHRPLTVMFWWALGEDGQLDSTFELCHLTNGRGFVSHFSRGKGEWCALERPVAVLQVYCLDGIQNVNGIYDGDLAARLDLRAGIWHHTALVFQGASLVQVYTDGRPAWETRLAGRPFSAEDQLHDLSIGGRWGLPVALDEVILLGRALTAAEIAEYVIAIRQLQAAGYSP